MAKTATINIRVEPAIKMSAEALYSSFGITVSDAINMFLYQSVMDGGLPFNLKQPHYNKETEEAIQETRDLISGKKQTKVYTSVSDMMADLDA